MSTANVITICIFLLFAASTTPTFCLQEKNRTRKQNLNGGLLASWNPATTKADFIVAKDGSGTHRTITAAVAALRNMSRSENHRAIVYVKAGVYKEEVEIEMKNVMFVGDGIDRTIITSHTNNYDYPESYLFEFGTFVVKGNGFWARDMTFENTVGPEKYAVTLKVNSDRSVFYRCSIKGYQGPLQLDSGKQFYRDCHIYGTVDIICGNAAVVFQNCDIFVREPMKNQQTTITAQGRDKPDENTGISIQGSRVRPAPDFLTVKKSFKTFLGTPWKKYSRTVYFQTDLGGLIDPKGWKLEHKKPGERLSNVKSTVFYAEYNNTGIGAQTEKRVNWPGFHVLKSPKEVSPFTVSKLIQGESWIPVTGVPCQFTV